MHLTVPTMLTLLRIALVPVLVLFFYLPVAWSNLACVIIFVAAAITDIADGAIAASGGTPVEMAGENPAGGSTVVNHQDGRFAFPFEYFGRNGWIGR